jgi:hypothetical protein
MTVEGKGTGAGWVFWKDKLVCGHWGGRRNRIDNGGLYIMIKQRKGRPGLFLT